MHFVTTAKLHDRAPRPVVQDPLAVRARLDSDMLMQVFDSDTNAGSAGFVGAVKEIMATTGLAHPALVAMELPQVRIEVIEAANLAEVFTELRLALHAVESWVLNAAALVALDLFNVFRIESVRPNLASFLRTAVLGCLLLLLGHHLRGLSVLLIVTVFARVEEATDLTLQRTSSIVVMAYVHGGLSSNSIYILFFEVKVLLFSADSIKLV